MNRTHRCELLARLPDRHLLDLAALVVDLHGDDIVQLTPPTVGMVMARVEDGAQGDVFNLGEVLVTECQVQVTGHEGWSMLLGSRPKGALAAASIDAATSLNAQGTADLDALLLSLIADMDDLAAAERARLAATRVQFDTQ